MMQYIKCRFVGSRIANTKTEMAYDLLEADFHFDLQPLNAKYVSLESTWCSISKYRFLGSRIANIITKMSYNLLEADFYFDI